MRSPIYFLKSKRPPAKQVAFTKPFRSLEGKAKRYNHRQSRWLRNGSEPEKHTVFCWMNRLIFYYPLTISGTILTAISVVLFGKSYTTGNSYGFVLSLFALFTLLILILVGRLQAARFKQIQFQWDSSQPLYAGMEGIQHQLRGDGIRTFYFYRLHFKISGRITVGRNAYMYISHETSSAEGKSLSVPLYFPLAGEFQARGGLKICDLFGLTRARFGRDNFRKLMVQPALFADDRSYHIEAVGGFEDKNRKKRSEEERYYMREYIPGDRFRDINWKSSSRFSQLFTKISPYTQEKTRLIPIEFRHFRSNQRETVESLIHLNQLKSWLLSFLKKVKNENPEYHFIIKTGRGNIRLETDEDIEGFSLDLSSIFFQVEPSEYQVDSSVNEIYIFSTPYDENLPAVLALYQNAKTHILRTVSNKDNGGKERTIHLFKSLGSLPFPGSWILRRDRNLPKPKIGAQEKGRVEEHPIKVKTL